MVAIQSNRGGNTGWQAVILAYPEWGAGVVVLTNSNNGGDLIGDVSRGLLPMLSMERLLRIVIPVLVLAFLICAFFFIKGLASHRGGFQ